MSKLERVREIMPPDGTDLVELSDVRAWTRGGVVADEVTVRFEARDGVASAGRGVEGFYERWRDWLEPWETYRVYTDEMVEREDRVVCLVRLEGVTRHGGVKMGHAGVTTYRFEGDEIVEMVFSMDREAALRE